MTTVFIAGSINIKHLHNSFVERINNVIAQNHNIIVGDADGADASIQEALVRANAKDVTVYCSGPSPRNNVGYWSINNVYSDAKEGTRAFFTAKDVEMAKAADFGLMVWDTKSTGTLSNVIELLKNKKISVVFVNKENSFVKVSSIENLKELIGFMSSGAKQMAEKKINLSQKVAALSESQLSIQF